MTRGPELGPRSSIFLRAPCHGQRDIFTSGEKPSEQSRTAQAEREIARRRDKGARNCAFRSSYHIVTLKFLENKDDEIVVGETLVRKKVDLTVNEITQ